MTLAFYQVPHDVAPAAEYVPGSHFIHVHDDDAPGVLEKVPA